MGQPRGAGFTPQISNDEKIDELRKKYGLSLKIEKFVEEAQSFEQVIKRRTATRKFSEEEIQPELIQKILEDGRLAPTAKNLQPQKIFVITSKEGLENIDKITPCRYGAPVCLLVCGDKSIAWEKDGYSTIEMDCSIVSTHLILAATSLDVDSVWVRNFDPIEVKKVFNLDSSLVPVCLIALGHRAKDCPKTLCMKLENRLTKLFSMFKFSTTIDKNFSVLYTLLRGAGRKEIY